MAPRTPVSAHVLKMKGYIDTLEKLGIAIPQGLAIDLILGSLPESFDSFCWSLLHNVRSGINKNLCKHSIHQPKIARLIKDQIFTSIMCAEID